MGKIKVIQTEAELTVMSVLSSRDQLILQILNDREVYIAWSDPSSSFPLEPITLSVSEENTMQNTIRYRSSVDV
jgi:hypothetical protein